MIDGVRLASREYKARSTGEREGNSGLRSAPSESSARKCRQRRLFAGTRVFSRLALGKACQRRRFGAVVLFVISGPSADGSVFFRPDIAGGPKIARSPSASTGFFFIVSCQMPGLR
jgi:hypothetical protein